MKLKDIHLFNMSKTQRHIAYKMMFVGGIMIICQAMMWILAWPFILIGRLTENILNKLYLQYDLCEWLEYAKEKEAEKENKEETKPEPRKLTIKEK